MTSSCISLARVVGALPGSTYFPAVLVGPNMENLKSKILKSKSKSISKSKIDEEEMGVEMETEPRVVLTPLRGHFRTSSVSSNITDDWTRPGTSGLPKEGNAKLRLKVEETKI